MLSDTLFGIYFLMQNYFSWTIIIIFCFPCIIGIEKHMATNDELSKLLQNEDIKNTWNQRILQMCVNTSIQIKETQCIRWQNGFENINIENLNFKPLVLKISKFLDKKYLEDIEAYFNKSIAIETQGVEGYSYNKGHRGRRADGLWLEHNVPIIRPLFNRLQKILRINPAIAEEFLILKYEIMGHYAIHYDYLDPMPVYYDDGWYEFYGNRLATALLLVKTANRGGFTIFPRLDLTIQPEKGDLLLWFNADSNNQREEDALHAACPILDGTKIAISLWIRGNFQEHLKCSKDHAGYEMSTIFREFYKKTEPKIADQYLNRPNISSSIFNKL